MINPTLYERLIKLAESSPDQPFVIHDERCYSWSQARAEVDALASGMLDMGIGRGDKIALWLPNVAEWPLLWLASASIGATAVPVNTRYKAKEAGYVVGNSESALLCYIPEFLGIDFRSMVTEMVGAPLRCGELHSPHLPMLRHVLEVGGNNSSLLCYADLIAHQIDEDSLGNARAAVSAEDDAIFVYTSGTTGFPKGARHRHAVLSDVAAMADLMGVNANDRILTQLPFFHVGGSFMSVATALVCGAAIICVDHFTAENALRCIERHQCTVINGVPSHFVMMLSEIERIQADTSSARVGFIAGAMIAPEVVRGIQRDLGMRLVTMYGMTETTGVTTSTRLENPEEVLVNTVGRPIASDYEVAIFDPVELTEVPAGTSGEIWVRGHRVTAGYYKVDDPETFRPDGWFRTGDLGTLRSDGQLQITGRLKDMFIVGGTNTYPAEIEAMLSEIEEVAQAHVVGIPHERLGEVGMAFIQLKQGRTSNADTIIARCQKKLANYKVPRHVEFVDDFPMTASGKIQKYKLRDEAIRSLGLAGIASTRLVDYKDPG